MSSAFKPNSGNTNPVTLTAQWKTDYPSGVTCTDVDLAVNGVKEFDYTGTVQRVMLKKAGRYKLEVWGAQGGAGESIISTSPAYRSAI